MRIAVVGGGPAGLYFAILLKKSAPGTTITVHERNQPDDTFGFGVVFSDETLRNVEITDPQTYRMLTENFSYWDDLEIHFKGTVHRIGGNGFSGCSRKTLLAILHERCRELGVELVFGREIADLDEVADADLVIAADGINSPIRERFAEHFRPRVDLRPNKFAWLGSTRPLDAFTFFFRETEYGIFIAHTYQYEPGASTWVLETDPKTFERAGLGELSECEAARFFEQIFAEELQGHPLITNRSIWRNFPMIRNERWTMGNLVLLGDAKATAHFSIGSGTKLAMEDAIALHGSVRRAGNVQEALADFESSRREEVEKTQHAADVSLVWFEHLERFWDMEPTQFAFGVMTRSRAITRDNLELRAPDFVLAAERVFARQVRASGFDVDVENPAPPMFQPFRLRDMVVENRVVVSPMDMYCAADGVPGEFHLVHYGARALGGAGLIFTEMTCVSPQGRITPGCTGLWNNEQEAAFTRIVNFVHQNSRARFCLQIGHSGRKGSTRLMWDGIDQPLPEDNWEVISASPIPYFPHSQVPREITRADMEQVIQQFVSAAERGERAGFDMLEVHAAHGYLLASFLSPLTNRRRDEYGGSLENRIRFPLELFDRVREVWPRHKPMSVRISATDWREGGLSGGDALAIATAFADHGCDLIDVSTGQTVADASPIFGRMFQTPFSDQIRNEAHLATMCVGNITTADQVNTILAAGRADLVALGRPHLAQPSFMLDAAAEYGFDAVFCPPQYLAGKDQAFRNKVRARQELNQLKLKARPQHAFQKSRRAED